MDQDLENRRLWDTPTKAILTSLLSAAIILAAVFILPITIKQINTNQETRLKADTILTQPLITPISSSQVVVSFSTQKPTQTQLKLQTPSDTQTFTVSSNLQTSHAITLNHLNPQTTYKFSLTIQSPDSPATTSPFYNFTTPK